MPCSSCEKTCCSIFCCCCKNTRFSRREKWQLSSAMIFLIMGTILLIYSVYKDEHRSFVASMVLIIFSGLLGSATVLFLNSKYATELFGTTVPTGFYIPEGPLASVDPQNLNIVLPAVQTIAQYRLEKELSTSAEVHSLDPSGSAESTALIRRMDTLPLGTATGGVRMLPAHASGLSDVPTASTGAIPKRFGSGLNLRRAGPDLNRPGPSTRRQYSPEGESFPMEDLSGARMRQRADAGSERSGASPQDVEEDTVDLIPLRYAPVEGFICCLCLKKSDSKKEKEKARRMSGDKSPAVSRSRKSSGEGPSSAGPSSAGPSAAGPSSAGPSAAGPSGAGPSAAGPSAAGGHDEAQAAKAKEWEGFSDSYLSREHAILYRTIETCMDNLEPNIRLINVEEARNQLKTHLNDVGLDKNAAYTIVSLFDDKVKEVLKRGAASPVKEINCKELVPQLLAIYESKAGLADPDYSDDNSSSQ